MSYYNNFSPFYDLFTKDVNYKKRAKHILRLFKLHGKMPTLLLDFACGTGGFSEQFSKQGIDVIGVDKSDGMLCVAAEKNEKLKRPVLYLNQSGEELDLYGTVDGAICCLDSLNHITDLEELKKCFAKISLFLEDGCLFIFDLNTEYKHREILGNNTFKMRRRGVDCLWENRLKDDGLTVEITLNFTYKAGVNKKETVTEQFCERVYTDEQLGEALETGSFVLEAVYGENTYLPPKNNSQRNLYVARKVK